MNNRKINFPPHDGNFFIDVAEIFRDSLQEGDFFKCFAIYFNVLKFKKLIATGYADLPIVRTELDFCGNRE